MHHRRISGRGTLLTLVSNAFLLISSPLGAEADQADGARSLGVDELFRFLASQPLAQSGETVHVCHLGFGDRTLELSKRFLEDPAPPPANVHFLRADGEAWKAWETLSLAYPGQVHASKFGDAHVERCSVVVLAVEDPRFTREDIRFAAGGSERVLVTHMAAHCSFERSYECRFFHTTWDDLVDGSASCGQHFCVAVVPTSILEEPLLDSVDCSSATAVGGKAASERPPSTASQWQQDWFVYHNFIRGTSRDSSPFPGGAGVPGVFVDVGAFNPVHLSNTVFFERCLGWRGLCVEPNPSAAPMFRAYRPRCELVQNCVWSKPRSVIMSYEKDPIEAYIKDDPGEASVTVGHAKNNRSSSSGAVLIKGGGSRPEFRALCLPLQDILSSAHLRKPAIIDYLSVDAEAAEAEIFRGFPFEDFDISVISVEVQVQNYYELDVVLLSAGYAKIGVLGGDHVYAKLRRPTRLPARASEWHRTLINDFYTHAAPKTRTLTK